jgi:hypothetical protein
MPAGGLAAQARALLVNSTRAFFSKRSCAPGANSANTALLPAFAELKKAKKQLLEQAAVLALVLRRAVLPEALDLQPQFCGQASSALDRPSDAQLRSLHGSELPLAYKGGPWELEPLHLRLSLLDE